MIALVAGLGVGLAIGSSLAGTRSEPRRWRDRLTEEGLGRRLLNRIEGLLPQAVAEHFAR